MYELGSHYDALAHEGRDDTALLERVITGALQRRKSGPRRRGVRRAWVIGLVAALSSVSVAAAAITIARLVVHISASPSIGAASACGPQRSGRAATGVGAGKVTSASAPRDPSATATASPPDGAESSMRPHDERAAQRGATLSSESAGPTVSPGTERQGTNRTTASAAQMFSGANTLRKAGRLGEAEQAYRHLQRVHPGSPEAGVSRVLLGRILLRQGRAAAACAQFEDYLKERSRGNLAEEALQGNAMCLRALVRRPKKA
jgi:hypothetical protein